MVSRRQILATKVVTKSVSRVAAIDSPLLRRFGMQPGGPRVAPARQRSASYDIFNNTRTVTQHRGPGVPSATARRQAVGSVAYTIPRFAEKLPLLYEEMHGQREIGGPDTQIDSVGQNYIAKQERHMGQKAANVRVAQLGGMMRGHLYAHENANGDGEYVDFTNSSVKFDIDYRVPACNLGQLEMLNQKGQAIHGTIIDKSWNNQTANIPQHCMKINSAFKKSTGTRLELAVCNSLMWDNLVNNDYLVSQAGIANPAFQMFVRGDAVDPNSEMPDTTFEARFTAMPWLTWIVTDEGLELGSLGNETYTTIIPDNAVWFGPDPLRPRNRDLMEMLEGPEPVSDGPNKPPVIRNGLHAYAVEKYDPASIDLHTLDNSLVALYNPFATALGTVVF